MKEEFGIIITCYTGDIWLTKACLSSIKTYAPSLPIALIIDKNPPISELLKLYNIKYVIRQDDVKNKYFKEYFFGTRYTAAIALFESPFSKFLYLDSDTIFWGNICPEVIKMLDQYDFVHNVPHEEYTEFILKTQYFDYDRIFKYAPDFPWNGLHYFNSGVIGCRSGVLDPDLFIFLHKLWKKDRSLFPTDMQGLINFTVFYSYTKGKLSVGEMPLQVVIPVVNPTILKNEFCFVNKNPFIHNNIILHYAGLKPMNKSYKGFIEPVNYFRLKHLRESGKIRRYFGTLSLLAEEYEANFKAYYDGSIKKYIKYKLTGKK